MKLIITSGGSQLFTQIAALRYLNINLGKDTYVYYIGGYSEEMDIFLSEACKQFEINYERTILPIRRLAPIGRNVFYSKAALVRLFKSKRYYHELIDKYASEIINHDWDIVSIPMRHKVKEDAPLLSVLKYKRLILTADGVVDIPYKRNLNSWRWRGVKSPINAIPVEQEIYTPSYLKTDTEKLGKAILIPDEYIYNCFEETKSLPSSNDLVDEFFKLGIPRCILYSQHLAMSGACSELEEVNYYFNLIEDLIEKNEYPIIFKPHPRDVILKINTIKQLFSSDNDKVNFISKRQLVVPTEILWPSLKDLKLIHATTTSSAPLAIRKIGDQIVSYGSESFNKTFCDEIDRYTKKCSAIYRTV